MKKGELIRQMLDDPEAREVNTLKDKFLLVLALVYRECGEDFSRLDGLTWPGGQGVLRAKSIHQIENSFSSAVADQIYNSPFYAETGHSKPDLKRLVEMVLVKLGYPPGLRNEVRNFIEPPPKIDLLGMLEASKKKKEEAEQGGTGQPATRPESMPEGSDKPQPESEGRSR